MCYRPNRDKPNPLPQFTLKGLLLEALGFNTGEPIIVNIEHGRLVI
ncbi:MAG: SymE family type I addiction module toxin [Pantoea sp.]|nr:SymE family type I addiction module toxin [Pantoea sp. YU22]MDU6432364.1 SymE family type I addiction module toxin [Pantoea sp.]RTY52839.1 type I toxin-antitoxin system SymE family toxin [Pantoea sp. YU22]